MRFIIKTLDQFDNCFKETFFDNYDKAWSEFRNEKSSAVHFLKIHLFKEVHIDGQKMLLFSYEGNKIRGALKRYWRDDLEEHYEELYLHESNISTRSENGRFYLEDWSEELETTELIDVDDLYVNINNDYYYKGRPLDNYIVHKA